MKILNRTTKKASLVLCTLLALSIEARAAVWQYNPPGTYSNQFDFSLTYDDISTDLTYSFTTSTYQYMDFWSIDITDHLGATQYANSDVIYMNTALNKVSIYSDSSTSTASLWDASLHEITLDNIINTTFSSGSVTHAFTISDTQGLGLDLGFADDFTLDTHINKMGNRVLYDSGGAIDMSRYGNGIMPTWAKLAGSGQVTVINPPTNPPAAPAPGTLGLMLLGLLGSRLIKRKKV